MKWNQNSSNGILVSMARIIHLHRRNVVRNIRKIMIRRAYVKYINIYAYILR